MSYCFYPFLFHINCLMSCILDAIDTLKHRTTAGGWRVGGLDQVAEGSDR
jgi:hypothetical protein